MSYRLVFTDVARDQIARWQLSDALFVDVHLRLHELEDKPFERLVRTTAPFDGMTCFFRVVDPADRFSEFRFAFLVVYGQDEQTLHVVRGGFVRTSGL